MTGLGLEAAWERVRFEPRAVAPRSDRTRLGSLRMSVLLYVKETKMGVQPLMAKGVDAL